MNELREQIEGLLPTYFAEVSDVDYHAGEAEAIDQEFTDRILALIAEAMLSEEVVKAVTRNIWVEGLRGAELNRALREKNSGPNEHHCLMAKEAITTALAAAGIAGAGQEGGGHV